ncbi:MAG: hypothetical protein JXQ79_06080, partial [Rhodobacteraceae bacterium]|nr:hypothetical protein [Paracoccaceae bacterium]
ARLAKTGTALQRRYNSKNPRIHASDAFDLKAVGTSNYQPALIELEAMASGFLVTLEPEADNPHDKHAVRVARHGRTLGYLPAEAAARWRKSLAAQGYADQPVDCRARVTISHGHERRGLRLDLDWPVKIDPR